MRTLLAAVGLTLGLAAPAHAAVTITAPDRVGQHAQVEATVDHAGSTVTFTIGDVREDAATVADGGKWVATATLDFARVPEGTHSLTATAGDDSGSKDVTVDLSVTVGLPAHVYAREPAIDIASDADSTLECRAGDDAFAPCTSPWKPARSQDGTYTYDVRATDDVGNTGTFTSTFVLDRTAPTISVTPDRRIVVTDANLDHADCAFDSGAYAPCPETLPDGTTSFSIRAFDKAGNGSSLVSDGPATVSPAPIVSGPDVRGSEGGILGGSAEQLAAKVSLTSTHTKRWTRLRTLRLTHVPAGIAVTASCHGGGCPQRAVKLTAHGGTVSLKGLTGRKLEPGAVITIALRRDGKLLQTLRVTIRRTAGPRVR